MKSFEIPSYFRSDLVSKVKLARKVADPRKRDFTPSMLDFGKVNVLLARHFGFCYGVENAIEISYRAISENPGKRIFLLSQMIHNQAVNEDLESLGIRFLMDTYGNELIPLAEVTSDDVVITPAFGTTIEMEAELTKRGIQLEKYNTTCPFVEKVWNRSTKLGNDDYTVVIHGKPKHEETRATFSHAKQNAKSFVVTDMQETELLCAFIEGHKPWSAFFEVFNESRGSVGFDPEKDLQRVGVVNQTTMLASDTQAIADRVKLAVQRKYGEEQIKNHFADTRDTLCYATNENQQATLELLKNKADLAIVIGGANSSNTSHLVELCEEKVKTFFIQSEEDLISESEIRYFDLHEQRQKFESNYLPEVEHPTIIITSGASCPDSLLERVMTKILDYYQIEKNAEIAVDEMSAKLSRYE
ncbi:MAG: 4-hydroxy-3-methylbut-2-enyl diphosphate reductase [Flavobacteriales bacterium]|nr:4-hydroxy-3-methylbut-2-enyl diphosphate reductase [Flavobacteriales bacterium]